MFSTGTLEQMRRLAEEAIRMKREIEGSFAGVGMQAEELAKLVESVTPKVNVAELAKAAGAASVIDGELRRMALDAERAAEEISKTLGAAWIEQFQKDAERWNAICRDLGDAASVSGRLTSLEMPAFAEPRPCVDFELPSVFDGEPAEPELRRQAGFHGGRELPEVVVDDWKPGKIGF